MKKHDTLKNVYLFKDLNDSELKAIAAVCHELPVSAGQEIFFKGQDADSFYVIQQGTVKILMTTETGDEVQISNLSSGTHFGEIPFLTGDKRTASAQSMEPTHLLAFPYKDLQALFEKEVKIAQKIYLAFAKFLANRLKVTTGDLTKARETLMRHY